MKRYIEYRVANQDLPADIGQLLRRKLNLNRNQISRLKFRTLGICVNGRQSRVTEMVQEGDLIRVCLESEDEGSVHLEAVPGEVDIRYEDEDILLVNKPAGVAVHPAHGHYSDTLANHLVAYYRKRGQEILVRPVGRLDKETSGLVLFAKNRVAAARLAEGNKNAVQKEYLALVKGCQPSKENCVNAPIKASERHLNRMVTAADGKPAVTHYKVIGEYEGYSLLSLWLENGRTHQIRVHMASIGHPLLGDRIYGETIKHEIGRAALHCVRMVLRQPFSGEWIEVTAPLPEDMERLILQEKREKHGTSEL